MMLRHRILALVFSLLLGSLPHLFALNNEELISLHEAGFGEDLILAKIDQEPAEFDLSADGLIQLKEAGLSEKIIHKALMSQQSPNRAPEEAPPANRQNETVLPSIAPPNINPESGKTYFMRHSLHYEGNKHLATNYARGELLPINTEVELLSVGSDKIMLRRLDTDVVISIVNVPKYTQAATSELAERMLADQKTPLEKLPEKFAEGIRLGEPRLGMTRELVLMARGYPPQHETPSLKNSRWTYWNSRFVRHTFLFEGDRLVEGRGLR